MNTITKKDLVKEITETLKKANAETNTKATVNQKTTEEMLNVVLETIASHLEGGDTVKIPGFVTFEVQEVPEREARNPQNGETIVVPAHNKLKTKVSKALKDRIY